VGLYALLGLLAAWLVAAPGGLRGRLLGALTLAGAAAPIPLVFIGWLAAHGALAAFYRDAVWIPLAVFPREMAAPYPPFWPPWPLATDPKGQGAWIFRLVCLLPPLPYGMGIIYFASSAVSDVRRRRAQHVVTSAPADAVNAVGVAVAAKARRAAFVAWLGFGAAIWATAFPRADFDHVQVALGTAFVLGGALLERFGHFLVRHRVWRLWRAPDQRVMSDELGVMSGSFQALPVLRGWRPLITHYSSLITYYWSLITPDGVWCRRWLPRTIACLLLSGFLLAGLEHARALHMGPTWSLRTIGSAAPRAAGILLDHDDAAELNRLILEVRRLSGPDDAIGALPWNAGLYFLAERRNPTRFDLIIPASVLVDDLPELERSLDGAHLIVYWTARDAFISNTSLDDRLPELDKYILSHYRAVGAVNAYRLLIREQPVPGSQ
jgi:hypothetical protein